MSISLVVRLPEEGPHYRLIPCAAVFFGSATILALGVLELWRSSEPVQNIIAILLVAGVMLNTAAKRAASKMFFWIDTYGAFAFLIILASSFPTQTLPTLDIAIYRLALLFLFVYYLRTALSTFQTYQALKAARQTELDRERLRAIGQLTTGVAHDFNNLLTVILGNLELEQMASSPAERRQLLGEVTTAARRGADMVSHLLAFSRRSTLKNEQASAFLVFEGLVPLLARLLPAEVSFRHSIAPNTPWVFVDVAKLQSVLMNLVINARDALSGPGEIQLSVYPSTDADRQKIVIFSVRDSGKGMNADVQSRVFEPYFTTKPVGVGSGLGLSMAQGFLQQSSGGIYIASQPGLGTTVDVWLPAISSQ
ncbi:MAG: ATP-binding protein [Pseudomonadota bacterium]